MRVKARHSLTLLEAEPLKAGAVSLNYDVPRGRGTSDGDAPGAVIEC
jgi:hypothetical protein